MNLVNILENLFQQLYTFKIISYTIKIISCVIVLLFTSNFARVLCLVVELTCFEAKKTPDFRDGVK